MFFVILLFLFPKEKKYTAHPHPTQKRATLLQPKKKIPSNVTIVSWCTKAVVVQLLFPLVLRDGEQLETVTINVTACRVRTDCKALFRGLCFLRKPS